MTEPLLLPAGARLLHIGPHKTGSTALQNALHAARPELERQGVRYAGRRSHDVAAIGWAVGRPMAHHSAELGERRWRQVVQSLQIDAHERAVLSSEFLSDAEPPAIEWIVDDLGGPVEVVVTLRPLTQILPSQWQQYVQRGLQLPYAEWLEAVLGGSGRPNPNPSFWHRHRHDALVARWAEVVGVDRVTVIVLDPADHALLPTTFETMLGLLPGTLVVPPDRENRSLTWAEVETVRQFNKQYFALGHTRAEHTRLMRSAAGFYLKQRVPGRDEPAIGIPLWAAEHAGRIGAEMAAALRSSGVRVVGDLARLADATSRERDTDAVTVAPELAARLAVGMAHAGAQVGAQDLRTLERRTPPPPPVETVSSRALVDQLAMRARRRAARATHAAREWRRG